MNPFAPFVQQSPANAEFLTDTRQFTLMSYFEAENYIPGIDRIGSDGLYARSATPLLYDIAAIHAKYGADMTTVRPTRCMAFTPPPVVERWISR